ncbi:hypothetical protein B1B_06645, partial [mine drainage metagenome]
YVRYEMVVIPEMMFLMTKAENRRVKNVRSQLADAIEETTRILPGSIINRMMRCGKANCRCHADPPELHGPYVQWSYTHRGKRITQWLNTEQQALYCPR